MYDRGGPCGLASIAAFETAAKMVGPREPIEVPPIASITTSTPATCEIQEVISAGSTTSGMTGVPIEARDRGISHDNDFKI